MQNNKKIIEIGKKLPHGAKKRIAVETGLHYNTVVGYFNGRSVSYHTESLIIIEVWDLLNLIKEADKTRQNLLSYGL